MTNETQQKIIVQFQKETNFPFNAIDQFLIESDITIVDATSISNAIDKHKKALDKIEIPELIGSKEVIVGKKYNWVAMTEGFKTNTVKTYKNGLAEAEVNKLKNEKKNHQSRIKYLELLQSITKRFNPEETSQQNGSKIKNKDKRDTRPKESILIDSFIKNAYIYVMEKQSEIAKYLEVSEGTISRYFNRYEFLKKLCDFMNKEYKEISKEQYNNEISHDSKSLDNFSLNFSLINSRLENFQVKQKFEKAKNDLPGLTEKENKLQIKNKS